MLPLVSVILVSMHCIYCTRFVMSHSFISTTAIQLSCYVHSLSCLHASTQISYITNQLLTLVENTQLPNLHRKKGRVTLHCSYCVLLLLVSCGGVSRCNFDWSVVCGVWCCVCIVCLYCYKNATKEVEY